MCPQSRKRILVTGASGCLGHYIIDEFMNNTDHELVLIVRRPEILHLKESRPGRVSVIKADLAAPDFNPRILGTVNTAVLAAACWGGPDTVPVNVKANRRLTQVLAEGGCRRFIYISSASVLDSAQNLLTAAREIGTEYIQSKYQLVEMMETEFSDLDLTGIFPTLLVGGTESSPSSHFSTLLRQAAPWTRLVRHFRADGAFHLIHCRDAARIICHLAGHETSTARFGRRIVIGNPSLQISEFISQFCRHMGHRSTFQIKLPNWLANLFIKAFRIQLSIWDRYCLSHRDQSYPLALNPSQLGLQSSYPDLTTVLNSIQIGPEKKVSPDA